MQSEGNIQAKLDGKPLDNLEPTVSQIERRGERYLQPTRAWVVEFPTTIPWLRPKKQWLSEAIRRLHNAIECISVFKDHGQFSSTLRNMGST